MVFRKHQLFEGNSADAMDRFLDFGSVFGIFEKRDFGYRMGLPLDSVKSWFING